MTRKHALYSKSTFNVPADGQKPYQCVDDIGLNAMMGITITNPHPRLTQIRL